MLIVLSALVLEVHAVLSGKPAADSMFGAMLGNMFYPVMLCGLGYSVWWIKNIIYHHQDYCYIENNFLYIASQGKMPIASISNIHMTSSPLGRKTLIIQGDKRMVITETFIRESIFETKSLLDSLAKAAR